MKILTAEKEARQKLLEGFELMYKFVCTTLGPKGRNIAIGRQWGSPIVVHDGVTVAREVQSKDEFVNMGIELIREAAQKTNQEAGDGTTTSTLIAYWVAKHGMELVEKGLNPMVLRKQLEKALPLLKEELKKITTEVKDNKDVERVAFISSASEEIGRLVAEAIAKVGNDGLVTVDESKTGETYVDYTEGMEFDKGYMSQLMVTNLQRMEAVVEDPQIVILDKKITMPIEIVPLLETLAKRGKNIVIIGEVGGEALNILVANKLKGIINALVVEPPGYADRRKSALDDLAVLTGATVISAELGLDPKQFEAQFKPEWIGGAAKVASTSRSTVIIKGKGDKKQVEERIKNLREQIKKEDSVFEKEKLEERLAKLTTGVGVIKVGAKTDVEMREKVERVKDAVGAARAALEEGIVPGGGVAFLRLLKVFANRKDLNEGEQVLQKVLQEPIRKLLVNAGEDEKSMAKIITEVANKGGNYGYEVNESVVKDLLKAGVIDPAKVIRLSLENGISVASSALTTDGLIADELEKPKEGV